MASHSFARKLSSIGVLLVVGMAASTTGAATLPPGFRETIVAQGLSAPTAMQFAPDGRLFVCEQGGRLRVIKDGVLLPTPFLTVTVSSVGERGLLGVAFDPHFATNRFVYVYYTATTPTVHNRIARFVANGDVAVPGSETIILELDTLSSATNHNGGALNFGDDGKLYAAVGDNANGANAQSLTNLLGKVLRINSDGTIPADNPFYHSATGKNRAIWALGLRNPFTFAFNAAGNQMFINDVGQNTWEEINDGFAGANYGWPATEGPTTDSRFQSPRHAYAHSAGACAITGGAFYVPAIQFPTDYASDYLFADYCAGWIRKLDLAGNSVAGFATGISFPVDLKVADDGTLYYLARGTGASTGVVYRIEWVGGSGPTITTHPQNRTAAPGSSVTFSVRASGPAPLRYQWQRNGANIAGATAPDYTIAVVASDNGARFRAVVSNEFGSVISNEALLTVTANRAPTAAITQPATGTLYSGGNVITYAGSGTDPEDGTLPASAFTWRVDFHHATHFHPFIPATTGSAAGSFTIPTTGETSADVWYRVHLTVRDSGGLTHSAQRDILPRKVRLTLSTNPAGLTLKLDEQPTATPISFEAVVGITRTLEAVTPQAAGATTYGFVSWSDGGAARHQIATPAVDTTYHATYRATGSGAAIKINFQPGSAAVPAGYLPDAGLAFASRNGQTYGWNADNSAQMRDRNAANSPDQRYDTLAYMQRPGNPDAVWEIALPNGAYSVRLVAGDPSYFGNTVAIAVEGVLTVSGTTSTAQRWLEGTSRVAVADSRLTIRNAPGSGGNKICFVEITPDPSVRINFQPAGSAVPAGYVPDVGHVFADRGNGRQYGWNADTTAQMRDRNASNSPDQQHDTLAYMQRPGNPDASWEIALPAGTYVVRVVAGDPSYFDSNIAIAVEGVVIVSGITTSAQRWLAGSRTVSVSDGRLTIRNAAGASGNKICFVEITRQ